jgi:hypothetical protein
VPWKANLANSFSPSIASLQTAPLIAQSFGDTFQQEADLRSFAATFNESLPEWGSDMFDGMRELLYGIELQYQIEF